MDPTLVPGIDSLKMLNAFVDSAAELQARLPVDAEHEENGRLGIEERVADQIGTIIVVAVEDGALKIRLSCSWQGMDTPS